LPACSARRSTQPREARIFSKRSIWSQLLLALGATATIVVTANVSRPIYLNRERLTAKILPPRPAVDSAELRAPWMRGTTAIALSTPQFLLDRELFAMDLLRTGHVSRLRARTLADIAVREAYTRKIPPALVLGVMLTENDELKSSARSVGALALGELCAEMERAGKAGDAQRGRRLSRRRNPPLDRYRQAFSAVRYRQIALSR